MRVVKTFHVLQHFAPFESKTDNNISPLRAFCPIFCESAASKSPRVRDTAALFPTFSSPAKPPSARIRALIYTMIKTQNHLHLQRRQRRVA